MPYLVSPDFWGRTLQNWQSELLAIGTMAVFAIYLRERGSPESKEVGAPHGVTTLQRLTRCRNMGDRFHGRPGARRAAYPRGSAGMGQHVTPDPEEHP